MKVVMGSGHLGEQYRRDLRATYPEVTFEPAYTEEEQVRHIRDAEIFFGWPTREVFLAAQRLVWVHCPGTGVDKLTEVPEFVNSDVILTNARGPHTEPMADQVFAFILTFAHRMREQWEDQQAHRWDREKYSGQMLDLNGRTMGILSLGGIGLAVARRAHGFGMKVYAVDIHPMSPPPEVEEVWGLERLDDLLQNSDWFVVTTPLTPETRGLVDRRRVGLLKPGSYFIVISRGGIVDEAALIEALRSGRIAGAGLDAVAEEPLPPDNPLWDMDNVLISAHISADSQALYEGRRQIFKENMRRFLAKEPFLYVCDKKAGF